MPFFQAGENTTQTVTDLAIISRDFFARPREVRCPWNFSKNCQSCSNWRSFVVTVRWGQQWISWDLGSIVAVGKIQWGGDDIQPSRVTKLLGGWWIFWPRYIGIKVSRETRIPSWTNQYVIECHVKVFNVAKREEDFARPGTFWDVFPFVGGKSWLAFVRKPMVFVQVCFFYWMTWPWPFFCWKTSKGSATSLDLQQSWTTFHFHAMRNRTIKKVTMMSVGEDDPNWQKNIWPSEKIF